MSSRKNNSASRDVLIRLIDCSYTGPSALSRIVTVSALANSAGLSRTALYKTYPDVIEYMRAKCKSETPDKSAIDSIKIRVLKDRCRRAHEINKSLARACSDLIVEIAELKRSHEALNQEKDLRISYLEDKLGERSFKPKLVPK